MILLAFAVLALSAGGSLAVPYGSYCNATVTCTYANNACLKQSVCSWGICDCAAGYTRINSACQPEKLLGDSCTTYCSVGNCVSGICQCSQGQVGSSDRRQCLGKKLGETCATVADCQGSNPTLQTVRCATTCQCAVGYKPYNDYTCTWHEDGETCTAGTTQCSPLLASCDSSRCTCNTVGGTKYEWTTLTVLGVTMGGCVHPSSTKNVGLGEPCTVNTYDASARFCGNDLLCARCPEDALTTNYKCLSLSGVGQMRANFLAIVVVFLLGIKIAVVAA